MANARRPLGSSDLRLWRVGGMLIRLEAEGRARLKIQAQCRGYGLSGWSADRFCRNEVREKPRTWKTGQRYACSCCHCVYVVDIKLLI